MNAQELSNLLDQRATEIAALVRLWQTHLPGCPEDRQFRIWLELHTLETVTYGITLAQQLDKAQTSLSDAENQAVQDALKLNDLLQQRANLEKQLAQQLFDIQNSDSLE